MAAPNLFQELKDALKKFKDFLDQNTPTIKPVIQALKSIVPQITELLDKLIDLMGKLKEEIQKLNVGAVGPGLDKVTAFLGGIKALLTIAQGLFTSDSDKAAVNDVLKVVDVVGSLPSLDALKGEIIALIDGIVSNLNTLKA